MGIKSKNTMFDSTYHEYIASKGYTQRECYKPAVITIDDANTRGFTSIEEYKEAIHEFLNGN